MSSSQIELRDGWWWPRSDQACWAYMNQHPDLPRQLATLCESKGTVLQAGGNAGYYVKQYADLFARVITFEPLPVNFACLTLNCDHASVIKFQACVGNDHEWRSLTVNEGDLGATHVSAATHGYTYPTMRLDDLKLDEVSLIQLDLEGFEYAALQGGQQQILRHRPLICVEYYEPWAARYGITLKDLDLLLAGWRYDLDCELGTDRIYRAR